MDVRNLMDLKSMIRNIPDYPKPGIMFRDVTTLMADPKGLRATIDELIWPFLKTNIDFVAGIEARGFILGGRSLTNWASASCRSARRASCRGKPSARNTALSMAWTPSRFTLMP